MTIAADDVITTTDDVITITDDVIHRYEGKTHVL